MRSDRPPRHPEHAQPVECACLEATGVAAAGRSEMSPGAEEDAGINACALDAVSASAQPANTERRIVSIGEQRDEPSFKCAYVPLTQGRNCLQNAFHRRERGQITELRKLPDWYKGNAQKF